MAQQKDLTFGDLSFEAQAELVREIKKNVASLKLSIDQILVDMDTIRNSKLEIIDKVTSVKNENVVNNAQLQVTLVKAKKIIRKSEDNKRKLELVLKKMNDATIFHTLTDAKDPQEKTGCIFEKRCENNNAEETPTSELSGKEKIRLQLLDNNKYVFSAAESSQGNQNELVKMKSDFKWGKDSALKELQWIVKMKLYKLRHRYDKLLFDQDLEERMPLPLSWKTTRRSSEQA